MVLIAVENKGGRGWYRDFLIGQRDSRASQEKVGSVHQEGFLAIMKNCLPSNFQANGTIK
jgi:hypothetical protein